MKADKNRYKSKTFSQNKLPPWLAYLDKGVYSIKEVCELTGQNYPNVYQRFSTIGLDYVYREIDTRRAVRCFNWIGLEEFYKLQIEKFKNSKREKGK